MYGKISDKPVNLSGYMRKTPYGIANFERLIEEKHYDVNKKDKFETL